MRLSGRNFVYVSGGSEAALGLGGELVGEEARWEGTNAGSGGKSGPFVFKAVELGSYNSSRGPLMQYLQSVQS